MSQPDDFNMQTDAQLLNLLNVMYYDNVRQIQNLTVNNNEIRNSITEIIFSNRERRNVNRNANSNRNRNDATRNDATRNDATRNDATRNDATRNNTNNIYTYTDNYNQNISRPYISDSIYTNRINRNNTNYSPPIITSLYSYNSEDPYNETTRLANASARLARSSATQARQQRDNLINTTNVTNQNINNLLQSFFDPVEIYPTPGQIETSTRITLYRNILRPINTSCPISLENFNDSDLVTVIRHCGHIFNTHEVNYWFRNNYRCPVCRYDIRNYNSTESITNVQPDNNPDVEINNTPNIDSSVNLINSLTDSILSSVLNQPGLINSGNERLFNLLDPSNNPLDSTNLLTAFYYSFPITR